MSWDQIVLRFSLPLSRRSGGNGHHRSCRNTAQSRLPRSFWHVWTYWENKVIKKRVTPGAAARTEFVDLDNRVQAALQRCLNWWSKEYAYNPSETWAALWITIMMTVYGVDINLIWFRASCRLVCSQILSPYKACTFVCLAPHTYTHTRTHSQHPTHRFPLLLPPLPLARWIVKPHSFFLCHYNVEKEAAASTAPVIRATRFSFDVCSFLPD